MNDESRLPERGSLPHLTTRASENRAIIQFVTVCVAGRRQIVARPEAVALLRDVWQEAAHWRVGRYVIMPDHIHLFCGPATSPPSPLKAWMAFWRATATRLWPAIDEKPIWQRDYFDRQLRTGESYGEKWHYVRENPVRAGLVARSEDWPYQGELHALPWYEP